MALRAVLRGHLGLALVVIGAHRANLLDADAERFLAEHVHVAVQRPVGDEGVMVIGRANDHGFHILLVHQAAPVPMRFRLGEDLQRLLHAQLVHVEVCHEVLVPQSVVVRCAASPHADERHVESVARGGLSAQHAAAENRQPGRGRGGLQQLSSVQRAGLLEPAQHGIEGRRWRRARYRFFLKISFSERTASFTLWPCGLAPVGVEEVMPPMGLLGVRSVKLTVYSRMART